MAIPPQSNSKTEVIPTNRRIANDFQEMLQELTVLVGQKAQQDKQEQDKVVIENIAQITKTLLTKSLLSL